MHIRIETLQQSGAKRLINKDNLESRFRYIIKKNKDTKKHEDAKQKPPFQTGTTNDDSPKKQRLLQEHDFGRPKRIQKSPLASAKPPLNGVVF